MKTLPYNADNVQALGMRFAKEWNDCKDELIAHTQWEPTKEDPEFDYAKHWSVMKELVRGQLNSRTH